MTPPISLAPAPETYNSTSAVPTLTNRTAMETTLPPTVQRVNQHSVLQLSPWKRAALFPGPPQLLATLQAPPPGSLDHTAVAMETKLDSEITEHLSS